MVGKLLRRNSGKLIPTACKDGCYDRRAGDPDAIALPQNRAKIANDDDLLSCVCKATKGDHALFSVVRGDEGNAERVTVSLVKWRMGEIKATE